MQEVIVSKPLYSLHQHNNAVFASQSGKKKKLLHPETPVPLLKAPTFLMTQNTKNEFGVLQSRSYRNSLTD